MESAPEVEGLGCQSRVQGYIGVFLLVAWSSSVVAQFLFGVEGHTTPVGRLDDVLYPAPCLLGDAAAELGFQVFE